MKIAVSACLLGEACRYDGRAKPCAPVIALADRGYELVPVCPEVAGGLPTPRTPCEVVSAPNECAPQAEGSGGIGTTASADGQADRPASAGDGQAGRRAADADGAGASWKIVDAQGADRTREYALGAARELARAQRAGCELAILKAKSPSCGSGEIYDGTFTGTLTPGWGIAAAAFRDAGIPVADENADFPRLKAPRPAPATAFAGQDGSPRSGYSPASMRQAHCAATALPFASTLSSMV